MPSTLENKPDDLHVAIIMDGNGRWAKQRGLPRSEGHPAGIEALKRTVRAALDKGIGTLTVYAFSSDNWRRPPDEVRSLMALLSRYLDSETEEMVCNDVRLAVIGRRDRLPQDLVAEIERAEAATAAGLALNLRVAIDYSARDAILRAASAAPADATRESFAALMETSDVDLLIRTGGEQRLSDFLLWECAYAELNFSPRLWPDFDAKDLAQALAEFRHRNRRFGGLSAEAA